MEAKVLMHFVYSESKPMLLYVLTAEFIDFTDS